MLPRPNLRRSRYRYGRSLASMEGRVLPRPNSNLRIALGLAIIQLQWRVGCYPDRISSAPGTALDVNLLQWRVGCYPDRIQPVLGWPGMIFSLQWRVGCYPDRIAGTGITIDGNGMLQWRVGCYPDRIRAARSGCGLLFGRASMEGRVLPRPNVVLPGAGQHRSGVLQWRVGCYPDRILPGCLSTARASCFNGGSGVTPTESSGAPG